MRPTEILSAEHKNILEMLAVLEKVAKKLEAGEAVEADHLVQIVEFIQMFADKFHHAKEEDLLFPAMERAGIPREGGPIGVMLQEHEVGRGYVRAMKEGAEKYRSGDTSQAAVYAQNARNFVGLLWPHIEKEDTILYRIADMHLTGSDQEELLREFERVEKERFGAEKDEKYQRILKDLKEKY